MEDAGTLDELFLRLMRERLTEWLDLADTRLRPLGVPLFFMLGNDDPPELAALLDQAPWGTHAEGKVVHLDDDHEMISWGYANTTPWHTYREQDEQQLASAYARMAERLERPERAVFNLHPPPYNTQLDDAPSLDRDLRVQATLGQVQYAAVGSTAVRDVATRCPAAPRPARPRHESSGIRRLGPRIPDARLVANPGCYPTAANLAIRPLVDAGVIDRNAGIVCDAKSGVSGAGRKPTLKTSFCEVTENFSAYSIFTHRHVPEVLMVSGLEERDLSFTAQLLPLDRGILETIYFRTAKPTTADDILAIYETALRR